MTSNDGDGVADTDHAPYLAAYSKFTDAQVEIDPHKAVGGAWEEFGQLQFDFLVRKGLSAQHRLLDVGCGTLRAGRYFIRYLDAGNYSGIDISPKALEFATGLVDQEGLSEKEPRLTLSTGSLEFAEFAGEQFDYLLAQSVFTHLPAESIDECLAHVGLVMRDSSRFYFTYNDAPERVAKPIGMDFRYPLSFFELLAGTYGFRLEDCSAEYAHPRGQRMLEVSRPT